MAGQLKQWLSFRRTQSSSQPTWRLTTARNSTCRGSYFLFWPLWAPHTHGTHTQEHTQNIKKKKNRISCWWWRAPLICTQEAEEDRSL